MDWDEYFLRIANTISLKSKDQSQKIGAVIIGPEKQIISTGFNGFPRGIDEANPFRWERPIKYDYVEHAERNAIYNAARHGISLRGSTLYLWGFGDVTHLPAPCISCTKGIIQAGIAKVVGYASEPANERWFRELDFSIELLQEANVEFVNFTGKL